MATYYNFTSSRPTEPDPTTLTGLLRASDATYGVQHVPGTALYVVKRSSDAPWLGPEIAAVQTTIDTAPAASFSLTAQANILAWPIEQRALVLALVDAINVLRAAVTPPLAAITPAQALAAVVNKAKTLT